MLSIVRTLGALSIVPETEAGYKAALSSSLAGSQGSPNSSQQAPLLTLFTQGGRRAQFNDPSKVTWPESRGGRTCTSRTPEPKDISTHSGT